MDTSPLDLIQLALDLMGQRARVTIQGTRDGGVLTLRATIVGVTGDNMLLVDVLRLGESAEWVPATSKISFDNIIEISPLAGEDKE